MPKTTSRDQVNRRLARKPGDCATRSRAPTFNLQNSVTVCTLVPVLACPQRRLSGLRGFAIQRPVRQGHATQAGRRRQDARHLRPSIVVPCFAAASGARRPESVAAIATTIMSIFTWKVRSSSVRRGVT